MRGPTHCFGGVRWRIASHIVGYVSLSQEGAGWALLKRFYLAKEAKKIRRLLELRQTLEALVDHGVLVLGPHRRYTLSPERSGFFVLFVEKRVKVSAGYHRSMRLHTKMMALEGGIAETSTGTVVWADWTYRPHIVLHRPKRYSPFRPDAGVEWKTVKSGAGGVDLRLVFHPPLHAGDVVEYSFYTWTKNYYAKTRGEALVRFGDERVREGFGLRNRTDYMEIIVVPHRGYSDARVDYDSGELLSKPGAGKTIERFPEGLPALRWGAHRPPPGRYFVTWLPPDQP